MDRSWMRDDRLRAEYKYRVKEFLQFAESNAEKSLHALFLCPCVCCANKEPKHSKKEIMDHITCLWICQSYT